MHRWTGLACRSSYRPSPRNVSPTAADDGRLLSGTAREMHSGYAIFPESVGRAFQPDSVRSDRTSGWESPTDAALDARPVVGLEQSFAANDLGMCAGPVKEGVSSWRRNHALCRR